MRQANVIAGVVLTFFGLIMIGLVIPWQIETAPPGMMSARLIPILMMGLMIALSILLVITNLPVRRVKNEPAEPAPISRSEALSMAKILLIFVLSIALYQWLSPLAAGVALVVGTLVSLGERRLIVIVAMPAGLLLGIWIIFYKVLGTAIL